MKDEWGRRLFTTGAIVLMLLGLVHSLSLFEKPVPANDTERQLMDLMANYKFTLWDRCAARMISSAGSVSPSW